jgi:hypothetical protein
VKRALALVLSVLLSTSACAFDDPTGAPALAPSPAPSTSSGQAQTPVLDPSCNVVIVAAGDIVNDVATANRTGRVAALQSPRAVLVLGDNQYPDGALADYRNKYDHTSWGRLKPLTRPVPGNHEYRTRAAAGYFRYFSPPGPYYAFDPGCGWRAYALNSEIELDAQIGWLRADLAEHPTSPVVAYWHRPRWSSGSEHGSDSSTQPLWNALEQRTGVVLNGHEHNYERFAPQGRLRQFVVGTGGSSTYPFDAPVQGSQRRIAHTPGVLRLELQSHGAYRWQFLNAAGETQDQGVG